MDIPRQKPKSNRLPLILGAAAVLVLATLGLSQLKPAAPTVERSTLWIDTVKRGPMLRQVRGNGTLVPENQRMVAALTAGRVERVLARPGTKVEATTVVIELSNPDVQLEALDAERQLKLAEADLASLRSTLETNRLTQQSALATSRLDMNEAERGVKVAERLLTDGLASAFEVERARDKAEEAKIRYEADRQRLVVAEDALKAQLDLRRADVDRLRAIAQFQRERVQSMQVRAGAAGVVQELALEPGQWVMPGQLLARVIGPDKLKAVIRVPETQARDVALGLKAVVDTRNGTVNGHVARIDPAAENGTVAVDITLEGALPRGARPDLSVDGTIEIERLADVLSVGRPADGASEATVGLFRLDADGHNAQRVQVRLGRASVNTIEVIQGLKEGDQVILSEMSRWDAVDRVRLK